ncbi:MAG: hypothetical protein H7Z41_19995 [Cytophagales bacterium]|nr:hypothetical protein [Armatimonadota bacterium]
MKTNNAFKYAKFNSVWTVLFGLPLYFSFAIGDMSLLSAALWHLGVTALYWLWMIYFDDKPDVTNILSPLIIAIWVAVLTPTFHQAHEKYRQKEERRIRRLAPQPDRGMPDQRPQQAP